MLIIKIQNDGTGTAEVGNYRYQVMINQTVIESGEVTEHHRNKGWQQLVEMVTSHSRNEQIRREVALLKDIPYSG